MNKKRDGLFLAALILLTLFLISLSFLSAETTNASFEKSYDCLKKLVDSKISSGLTSEELSFSLLALGYDSTMKTKIKTELDKLSKDGECWPKSSCNLKETSLALFAYNHLSMNTQKIESWLSNQTLAPTDLTWYLQIDSDSKEKAECTIKYDSTERKITVNEDKTLAGSAGNCLSIAAGGIWLEVASSCHGKEFEISCNKDFLTNLIYKKKTSSVYYVSSLTNTAAVGGKTAEKVESSCFKQGSSCNYEGSLWASLALQKSGNDIKKFLPYLLSLSEDNKRYNPSAFLYILTTGFDEYFTDLINSQTKDGYWQLSDTSKRYYDTALSILALGTSAEASLKARDYLLTPKVQGDGCYNNNIRDTSFIVYSASPKSASATTTTKSCSSSGYYCQTSAECEDVNGTVLSSNEYSCLGVNICCNKKYTEKTCSERRGKTCLSNQECTGAWASGLDKCCLNGICQEAQERDDCTPEGGRCKTSCTDDEEEINYNCPENGKCCKQEEIPAASSKWWIWLLIILIILLILAIIFRNQLKIWLFRIKSKFSKQPIKPQTRPFSQSMPQQGGMPRRIIPGFLQQQRAQKPFPKDRELEETLRKLRDMGK